MPLETFYATASALCFTLLGFWWAVVQFRHDEWSRDIDRRRMAYAVSLHFLLPGIMSLLSLLAPSVEFLWRTTFALAGLLGIVATLMIITSTQADSGNLRFVQLGEWMALPFYALITIFAILPGLTWMLGIPLQPLELEGIMLAVMVFLGVNFAWIFLTEPKPEAAPSIRNE